MKVKYTNPEMEIILLYDEGIITSSTDPLDPSQGTGDGTGEGEGIVLPGIQ